MILTDTSAPPPTGITRSERGEHAEAKHRNLPGSGNLEIPASPVANLEAPLNLGQPALTRLTVALGACALAIGISACGASFQSGEASPSPSPTTATQSTKSPSASPTACVNPSTKADYTLAGARTLSGNLQVKDLKIGTGTTAKVGSTVSVSYVGTLANGTVFDSSAADNGGKPVSLTLAAGKVIEGWVEGVPGMRVGGERELVIPPALGYGCTSPSSTIPADSTLIFTITLVSVS